MKPYRSIPDVAEEILSIEGSPMHYKELTKRIMMSGKM
jgi:hypothetical protein